MSITTTAKTKFFIGTDVAATTEIEFAADTYTEVTEVMDLGEVGDEVEVIEFATISDARMRKLPGIANAGTMEIVVARTSDDAGQVALKAAQATRKNHNFKVELLSGDTVYFRGIVRSSRISFGEGNSVVRVTFTIDVNSEVLEVEAA